MKEKLRWLIFRGGLIGEIRAFRNKWEGHILIGKNTRIGKNTNINRYMGGDISLSDNVVICENCKIACCGGDIYIGENTQIGDYATITAQGGVRIGNNVLFADNVSLIANEHNYETIEVPIMRQGSKVFQLKSVMEHG